MTVFLRLLLVLLVLVPPVQAIMGQPTNRLWQAVEGQIDLPGEQRIQPDTFQLFHVDFEQLKSDLLQAPAEQIGEAQQGLAFPLPLPDGSIQTFEVYATDVLAKPDQSTYPSIRTFVGHGIDDPYAYVRLDVTPHGFHSMILTHGHSYWVDPYVQGNTAYYMAYRKSDLRPRPDEDYSCQAMAPGLDQSVLEHQQRATTNLAVGSELLVYELAVACTGEYGAYHGGTKALAQAAIVTTINRVTGIFERDMSIRLILIPNNDTLLYVDPVTDPFSCCDIGITLNEGATLIENTLGLNNIDLGHTFCTYGGGLAAFGVCEAARAVGITGLTDPVGDPFDVDYVSHEIGHQFHGSHTFNYCPGQGGVPHEPGSGSTIMAYAGLCGTANMQTFSVDAFSVGTYEESVTFSRLGNGYQCPTPIPTGNHAPTVSTPAGGFYIPRSTPFELEATGSDIDGDSLTYSWEQWDFGPNVHPDSSQGDCPLFRVLWPTNEARRIFPQISDLVQGIQTQGEQLPSYGRTMTFRCAIRDNRGGADYDEMRFFVADSAGPFRVTYPHTTVGYWTVGSIQNITWDVAQTDVYPVNCGAVDVFLSTDGGYTYPILLAANRPNTGATAITVPNITGPNMRVKIKGVGNHFFDISDADFAIISASAADYTLTVSDPVKAICGPDTAVYVIELDTLGLFTDSVSLSLSGQPMGTGYAFSQGLSPTPETILLRVWNDSALVGDYSLSLLANSSSGVKNMPLTLRLRSGIVAEVSPVAPFNGATNVPISSVMTWNPLPFANSYRLQVDLSPSFSSPILDVPGLNTTSYPLNSPLSNNEVYYWRVQIDTSACGAGPWGPVYSFQTPIINCMTYASTDVPLLISPVDVDTFYSSLTVPTSLIITDVNVIDLEGTHTWMDDLAFSVISPQGTQVQLFGYQCGDQDDFWVSFDDTSSLTSVPCPPTTGLVYRPLSALANFNAEDAQGDWTLEVIDRFAADGGQVDRWALEICGPPFNTASPTLVNEMLTVQQGASDTLSTLYLQANCPDSSSQATYTLVSVPMHGLLLLDAQPLTVGDTFTQADIDLGLLSYQHDSLSVAMDQFQFTLLCQNGGYVGGLSFAIEVLPNVTVGINASELLGFTLYPNPARDAVWVRLDAAMSGQIELLLFDLMGKELLHQSAVGREMRVPIQHLSPGWYTAWVMVNGELMGRARLMRE